MGSVTMEGIAGDALGGTLIGFGDTGANGVLTPWLPLEVTAFSKYYNFTYAEIFDSTSYFFDVFFDQSSDLTASQAWPFGDVVITNITTAQVVTVTAAEMGSDTGGESPNFFFRSSAVTFTPWVPAIGDEISIEYQDIPEGQ